MREHLAAKGKAPRRCLSSPNISQVRTFTRFLLGGGSVLSILLHKSKQTKRDVLTVLVPCC